MFGTIRRHQAWLWWVIGGITILSFVALGPSGCNEIKLSGMGAGGRLGKIGGHSISQREFQEAAAEVVLQFFFRYGRWPDNNKEFNVEREAYFRLFLIQKEKDFGIEVSPETLGEMARRMLGNASLEAIANQLLAPRGLTMDDFQRYIAHEVGIQQLLAVAGLSGKLITPGEAETLYREENQEISCSMMLFAASNFMPTVSVTNPAVREYYTNRMSVYREPARVEVNYVKFNVTNYWTNSLKALTNIEAQLDAEVKRAGTNLFGHTKTPEESRAAIKDYIIRTNALLTARRDANTFADELDRMTPKKPENIETLAKQKGLTVKTTEPFDEVQGPTNLDVLYNFSQKAFELSPEDPFSGGVMAQDGVYVLGFKKQIPSAIPPFEDVQARVLDDFRYNQGAFMARQFALRAFDGLTNEMARGKSFAAAAAEQGLKTESLPPFSLDSTNLPEKVEEQVNLNALRQAAFSISVGQVSPPAPAAHGVFMVYVEKKLPIDEAKMKKDLPGFLAYMRQTRQAEAFNEWFNGQVKSDPEFLSALQRVSEQAQMRSGTGRTRQQ